MYKTCCCFHTDDQFYLLTKDGLLPEGWFAYHLGDNENIHNSNRVKKIAELAMIVAPGGGFFSERAEYGVPVWNGSAHEHSAPLAAATKSLPIAQRNARIVQFLEMLNPEGTPTTDSGYVRPLVEAVRRQFQPGAEDDGVVVMRWVREQPGCICVGLLDRRLNGGVDVK